MSIKVMNWAWNQVINNSARKLVLLALADRANDDGECWPGIANLTDKCSIPRRTLIRTLANLETQGLISIQHRPGEGSGRQTNLYQINFDPAENGQSANLAHRGQSAKNGGAKCQSDTRQSAKNGGAKCQSLAPNTSVDTSEKQPPVEPSTKETLSGAVAEFLTGSRLEAAAAQGLTDVAWIEAETLKFLNINVGKKALRNPDGSWLNWLHKGKEYAAKHPAITKPTKTRKSSARPVVCEQSRDPAAYRQTVGRFNKVEEQNPEVAA